MLGRGPAAEIRRVRLSRAKRLLAETDLPVPKVAQYSEIVNDPLSSGCLTFEFPLETSLAD